jgi:hypothetical protein
MLDAQTVECGGMITGTASWTGNRRRDQVAVALRYWTQGRGDRNAGVVASFPLSADETGQGRFQLPVPPLGPVSYNGQLLRLFWRVALHIPFTRRIAWAASGAMTADVTVVPTGWLRLPPAGASAWPPNR